MSVRIITNITSEVSTKAAYYVCITSINNGYWYVLSRYIKSYKENLVASIKLSIGIILFIFLIITSIKFWLSWGGDIGKFMLLMTIAFSILIFIGASYIIPLLAIAEDTFYTTIKNSIKCAIGYLPYTMIICFISLLFLYFNYISFGFNVISLFIC